MKTASDILREFGLPPPPSDRDRYYTTCPKCSHTRSKAHRKSACLGVSLTDDGVTFGCNHCGWKGGKKFSNGKDSDPVIGAYEYIDESGNVLFRKIKTASKKFWIEHPNDHGGWIKGMGNARKILYRLSEVLEGIGNGHPILIVEGEKDCDNLHKIGVLATCNFDGASEPDKKPKWRSEYSEVLRDADVVIVPDNDAAGYAHADAIASMSIDVAKSVRILKLAEYWPQCPRGGDVSDWLASGHDRTEFDALVACAKSWTETKSANNDRPKPFNSAELCEMRFSQIKSVVPGYIVEGLTLFAGKPKIGKLWLLLHAAVAVASGGFTLGLVQCSQGDVLYCALEDNARRLQSRMTKLLGISSWPERLYFTCEMPRLTEGGLDYIREWIESVNYPRLIIIDTLAMVRMPNRKDQSTYDADYMAVKALRDLAQIHGLAVVLVHHLRKADADDAFDTISGTLGLTGAPDTIVVLKRDASGTVMLHARGRDLIDIEKAVQFNADTCTWTILGDPSAVQKSNARGLIIAVMEEAGSEPLGPQEIADECKMKAANVRRLLRKMVKTGDVKKLDYGKYALTGSNWTTGHTGHTSGHTEA